MRFCRLFGKLFFKNSILYSIDESNHSVLSVLKFRITWIMFMYIASRFPDTMSDLGAGGDEMPAAFGRGRGRGRARGSARPAGGDAGDIRPGQPPRAPSRESLDSRPGSQTSSNGSESAQSERSIGRGFVISPSVRPIKSETKERLLAKHALSKYATLLGGT